MSEKYVTLGAVAEKLDAEFSGEADAPVTDVTHDSRQAGSGALFAAVRGLTMDGHRFVDDVMRRGAVGVISELERPENFQGAWLRVSNARATLAQAAAIINGDPSHQLKLVGITGTNGKTTTTYLTFALAEASGEKDRTDYVVTNEVLPHFWCNFSVKLLSGINLNEFCANFNRNRK